MASASTSVPAVVASIVLIGNDTIWRRRTGAFLLAEGFGVQFDDGAIWSEDARSADAAVVDLRLSARSGSEVCSAWRAASSAPLVAIAGSGDEVTVLEAYAAGADFVAAVEITDRQLLARLRSILRRVPPRRHRVITRPPDAPPIVLDVASRAAIVRGTPVPLSSLEFELLSLLIVRDGRVVFRAELHKALSVRATNGRAVDFFVRRLRDKLESVDDERRIAVVRGVGFRFESHGPPEVGTR